LCCCSVDDIPKCRELPCSHLHGVIHVIGSRRSCQVMVLSQGFSPAGIPDEQLARLQHIAHGAAMCQAHAAGLLQVCAIPSSLATQLSSDLRGSVCPE
jgi:hypothetical protein